MSIGQPKNCELSHFVSLVFLVDTMPAILRKVFCCRKKSADLYYQQSSQLFLIFKQVKIYRMHRWMNEWLESSCKVILMTVDVLLNNSKEKNFVCFTAHIINPLLSIATQMTLNSFCLFYLPKNFYGMALKHSLQEKANYY